ncbi:N/A [soil metagenome]
MIKKILIIDDNESILDAISLVLVEENYVVDTSIRGDQIFDKVESFKPDLILLDVLMSGQDGRDICRKLKDEDTKKHLPIIMISAHPKAKEGAIACGADNFLAKPFDTQVLLDMIASYN